MPARRRVPESDSRDDSGAAFRLDPRVALLAVLVALIGADVFRLGFFADDFHLLDVARRVPLWRALDGQYGIYPWYRPLSREIYFAVIAACGGAGLAVAHALRLACLFGCAWALLRVSGRLVPPRVTAVAPALFLAYETTRFLAGWSSGMQDLLSTFLVLLALADFADGRRRRALIWTALAPLAKETGFLALPLLAAYEALLSPERTWRRWLPAAIAVSGAVAALHLVVRLAWHGAGTAAVIQRTPSELLLGVAETARGFVGRAPSTEPAGAGLAIAAAVMAALLLSANALSPGARARAADAPPALALPPESRRLAFVGIGVALGLAPMIVSQLVRLTRPHAYYAFPAAPWLVLAAALALARAPALVPRLLVPALVGWNAWCFAYQAPDLERPEAWHFTRWDWREAMRLSEVSKRLSRDIRDALAVRPESLTVIIGSLPTGCYFQTEDGPATRVALGDPTVRAYYLHELPSRVDGDRLAIFAFDLERLHLALQPRNYASALEASSHAVMSGAGWLGYAFASFADTTGAPRFTLLYICAASRLLEEGPAAYASALAAAGVRDTLGAGPAALADSVIPSRLPVGAALAEVLRHPLSAAAHSAYAARLAEREFLVSAGVEYRIAVTLDPSRVDDRLALAVVLIQARFYDDVAKGELRRVLADPRRMEVAAEAIRWLKWLDAAGAQPLTRSEP